MLATAISQQSRLLSLPQTIEFFDMTPIAFGAQQRRLFGILHSRASAVRPLGAVVLCAPFGPEAVRAHRACRVLADRLARAGHDVLRFDYYGAGDSGGECEEADLSGWAADLRTAHAEVVRRTGARRVVWIGMRIGAAVAQLAARDAPAELSRLVLWDPIPDGRDYLDALRTLHLWWAAAHGMRVDSMEPVFRQHPDFYIDEAIGFAISRRLCDELRALRFAPADGPTYEILVIADPETGEGREVAALCRQSAEVRLEEVAHGTDWLGGRDFSGLVPPQAMKVLIESAGERA
jgi:pimeloyl-ACP methyl ester carboxylesterase